MSFSVVIHFRYCSSIMLINGHVSKLVVNTSKHRLVRAFTFRATHCKFDPINTAQNKEQNRRVKYSLIKLGSLLTRVICKESF